MGNRRPTDQARIRAPFRQGPRAPGRSAMRLPTAMAWMALAVAGGAAPAVAVTAFLDLEPYNDVLRRIP